METKIYRCPSCNAALDSIDNKTNIKCEYCGNIITIQKRNINKDGTIDFIDKASGFKLASALVPFGFEILAMLIPSAVSQNYPLPYSCSAYNKNGIIFSYFSGESYTDKSKCPLLDSPYAYKVNEISHMKFKNFMDVKKYTKQYMQNYAENAKADSLLLLEEREFPLRGGFNEKEALDIYKRKIEIGLNMQGIATSAVLDYYLKPICNIYELKAQGNIYKIAIAIVLEANKYKGFDMGLGTLINLFNKNNQNLNNSFENLSSNQIIDWASNGIFIYQSLKDDFEKYYDFFIDFVSSFKESEQHKEQAYNMQVQIQRNVQNYTQQNIAQQQRQFQTWQQINQSMQSAYDSYNQAWWDRNNSSYISQRNRTYSSNSPDFSEAIRGVNTYVRDDGSEVQISVDYDRAYTNATNDTLASNSAFEPGGNWTEMYRKR